MITLKKNLTVRTEVVSIFEVLFFCFFISWFLLSPPGGGEKAWAGQLLFQGVPVDITTAANETLVIAPGTGGYTQIGVANSSNTHATTNNDLFITGSLETGSSAYFDSTVTLGSGSSSTITLNGYIGSHAIPMTTATYDLGTTSLAWRNIYVGTLFAGTNAAIGTATPAATSVLDLTSTTKGFLAPRMTTIQRNAIVTPATGLFIYNTDTNTYNYFNGAAWGEVAAGGAPVSGDYVTLAHNAGLTADRVLTGTANQVIVTDNGLHTTVTLSTPQDIATASSPQFAKVKTAAIYPAADATTAVQIRKADGLTNVLDVDTQNSRVGIGVAGPSAYLHLNAGTAAVNTAPLKFTSSAGALLGTSEAGAMEFDGIHLYFTAANAGARYQLDQQAGGVGSLNSLTGALSIVGTTNEITVTPLGTNITLATPQEIATTSTPQFAGVKTAYVYPAADGAAAFQVRQADGATNVLDVDTQNSRVGIGTASPSGILTVKGSAGTDPLDVVTSDGTTRVSVNSTGQLLVGPTTAGNGDLFFYRSAKPNGAGVVYLTGATQNFVAGLTGGSDDFSIMDVQAANMRSLVIQQGTGNVGIGVTSPTARLHLKAGTVTANTAPLKFNSGVLLGTTEAGAMEFNAGHLYFTAVDSGARYQLDQQSGGVSSVNTLTGALSILGTTDEISVASLGTNITLSTPQPIATTSTPQFAGVNFGDANHKIYIYNTGPADDLTFADTSGHWMRFASGNDFVWFKQAAMTDEIMHLYNSGNLAVAGNIMIPSGGDIRMNSADVGGDGNHSMSFAGAPANTTTFKEWGTFQWYNTSTVVNKILMTLDPNGTLGFDGTALRTVQVGRNTAADGNNLVVKSGGSAAGSSDNNSGSLVLSSGIATGNGYGQVLVQGVTAGQGAGASERGPSTLATFGNTAYLTLPAGTAAAKTAPLKFTSSTGTLLGTTEAGAMEFDGTHIYFTAANGGTRYQLDQQSGGVASLNSLTGALSILGTTNEITVTPLGTNITLATPQEIATTSTPQFAGVKTAYVYPAADGTTAFQVRKADGATNVLDVDTQNSRIGIGVTGPTAYLHLKAGTATANTAPLKFTSSAGALLGTSEAGAMEFDGTHLYFTAADAGARYQLDQQSASAHNLLSATHPDTLTGSVARGDIIVGNATPKWARLAKGSSGQVLTGDGTDTKWSTATYPTSTLANRILYSSADNTVDQIASVNSGVLVTDVSGVPSISTSLPVGLIISGTGNSNFTINYNGNIAVASLTLGMGGTTESEIIAASGKNLLIDGSASSIIPTIDINANTLDLATQAVGVTLNASAANGLSFDTSTLSIDAKNHRVGMGLTAPTAYLQLAAGTAAVNTAPLKFTTGTLLGTTEAGTMEFNAGHLYFTAVDSGARYQLDQQSGGVASLNSLTGALSIVGTTNEITVTPLGTNITLATPQEIATTSTPQFAGVKTAYVYPAADGTTAFQVRKADGTTPVWNVDTTDGMISIGDTANLRARLQVTGSGAGDQIIIKNSDGPVDNKLWLMKASSIGGANQFQIVAANDAWNAFTAAMYVDRSNTNINKTVFPGTQRVGIGTDTPQGALDVNGDILIRNKKSIAIVTDAGVSDFNHSIYFDQTDNIMEFKEWTTFKWTNSSNGPLGRTLMQLDPTALSLLPYSASTAGQTLELRFAELSDNGSNYVGFKAPDSIGANKIWVLPNADGNSGEALKTDGSGNLSWGAGGAPTAAAFITLAHNAGLTADRVLTGTANQVIVTDNGALSTAVLSTPQDIATTSTPQFARMGIGGVASATNILSVDSASTTPSSMGLYVQHLGTVTSGTGYGGYFTKTGGDNTNYTNIGVYAEASGAGTNYSGYFNGSNFMVTSSGTTNLKFDRAATNNFALLEYCTAGIGKWDLGTRNTNNEDFQVFNLGTPSAAAIYIKAADNSIGIGGAGGVTSPTAYLHLGAGTNVASHAPLKFTAGTNLGTAEAGAMEWDGTNLFITQTTGPARKTLAYTDSTLSSVTADPPLSGAGTSASHLVIANAAADGATKGAAAFNSTNFSASTGIVNTIQDIATTSTPQFARMGIGGVASATNILSVDSASTTPSSMGLYVQHLGTVTSGTGYGGYFTKTGGDNTNYTNIGVYAEASGAGTNYSGYFNGSNFMVTSSGTTNLKFDRAATNNFALLEYCTAGIGKWDLGTRNTNNEDFQVFNLGTPSAAAIYIKAADNSIGIGGAGGVTSPTAYLHLGAGTNVASHAPLKFTAGTNLGTAEAGAMEWDGTNLFITQTTGPARKTLAYTDSTLSSVTADPPLSGAGTSASHLVIANAAADGATKGAAAFNSTNFSASTGIVNTIQDIATTSTPQFARMGLGAAADANNISTITSSSAAGADNRALNVSHTGAITGSGYAGYFSKTGGSTTNYGVYATASGAGTNNYGVYSNASGTGNYSGYFVGNSFMVTSAGTTTLQFDRGANSNFTLMTYSTGGTAKWDLGSRNTSNEDFQVYDRATTNSPIYIVAANGDVGIGAFAANGSNPPTAYLHLGAGTNVASHAPLKFTSGTVLGTPEAGAMEFNTDTLSFTITTGAARKTIAYTDSTITGNAANVTGTVAVGNGGTGRATGTTAYMPICAGTTAAGIQQTVAAGTQYYPMCYNTAVSLPTFQILDVRGGGTGRVTGTTAYALIAAGSTATGIQQSLASAGTVHQVLTSGGVSALPTWGTVTESSGALAAVTTINMSSQLTSTLATGTAPFVVSSTTPVANLAIGGNAGSVTGLSVTSGKTLTVNNSLTLAGTNTTTMTFPSSSATIARIDAANTFTGNQTIASLIGNKIYPSSDTLGAIQINKADGTTNVLSLDTQLGDVGIDSGGLSLKDSLQVGAYKSSAGTIRISPDHIQCWWDSGQGGPVVELNRDMGGSGNPGIGFGDGSGGLDSKIYRPSGGAYKLVTTAYQLAKDTSSSDLFFGGGTDSTNGGFFQLHGNTSTQGNAGVSAELDVQGTKTFDIEQQGGSFTRIARFWGGGGVRIGNTNTDPGANNLTVDGTTSSAGLTVSGSSITFSGLGIGAVTDPAGFSGAGSNTLIRTASSKRYKHDIRSYEFDPDKIKRLRPVRFKWNADTSTPNFEDIGLIAEEVNGVFPELVSFDSEGRPNNVRYNLLSVILLKEMQSQQSQIEEQHVEFSKIKTELDTLKQQNDQLQKQVEKLMAKVGH